MSNTKIQWHPGFVSAMNLELCENRNDLIYEREYNLNTKPLEIDLLVIKKDKDVQIINEIGKLFRGHNIMEYKSPEDELNIDTFYKSGAYASLYKSYGETVDKKEHAWLKALSGGMEKQDMEELLERIDALKKFDRELADSVLEVSIRANQKMVEELRGDGKMCQALLEIMEPEILKIKEVIRQKTMQETRQETILCAVKGFRDLGAGNEKIIEILKKNYGFTDEEAEGYL